jgi:SsrA-binding protein
MTQKTAGPRPVAQNRRARHDYDILETVWLHGVHVAPWVFTTGFGAVDPDRPRKLLLHRRQIHDLAVRTGQDALTLIPLSVYFKDGRAKVDLAVAKGRRNYDKRHAIADRDAAMEARRAASARIRGVAAA